MKRVYVSDLTPGCQVRDLFLIAEARQGQAKNGPYWSLSLQDASGKVEARIWSPLSGQIQGLAAGLPVVVQGQVELFRDQPQISVEALEFHEGELGHTELAWLVPSSKVSPEVMLAELEELLGRNLTHKPWKKLVKSIFSDSEVRDRLLVAPGAKAIHHAYAGGLLEHTLAVCRICEQLAELYPGLDREVLLVGAALHDIGKAWELSCGTTQEFTDPGRLLGHIQLGLEVVEPYLARRKDLEEPLRVHLKHMLLAHHGELAFGSPKRPKTAEAMVLHLADMIDSKLNTVVQAFGEEDGPGTWSPYVRSLERFLFKPSPTPRKGETAANRPAPDQ